MKTTHTMWPFWSRELEKSLKKKKKSQKPEKTDVFSKLFMLPKKLDFTHTQNQNAGKNYSYF